MSRYLSVFLCFFVFVQLGLCQFGFFPRREENRQSSITLLPNLVRNTLSGILHPNRNHGNRPITNNVNQGNQGAQGSQYPTANDIAQRPVAFPTNYPEEAPNYQEFTGQGNQGQFTSQDSHGQFTGQGNQEQVTGQGNQGQFTEQSYQGPTAQSNQAQGNQGPTAQGNQGTTAQGNQGPTAQGNQDTTGLGNLDTTVQGNQGTTAQSNQGPTAQGNQDPTAQGNQGPKVQGNQGITVQGNQSPTAQDNQGPTVQSNQGTTAQGNQDSTAQNNQGPTAQGNAGQNQSQDGGSTYVVENNNPNGIPDSQVDVPNDPVYFEGNMKVEPTQPASPPPAPPAPTTEATKPVSFPDTDQRNNFNFQPAPVFSQPCTTIDGELGSCISLYSCQPFVSILQESRTNPAVARMLRQAHCGFEGNNPKVCCPAQRLTSLPPSTTTTSTTTTTTTTPAPTPTPTAAAKSDLGGDYVQLPEPPVCGVSNASLGRVVGGENAKLGAFPWMALLGYRRGADTRWLCGGSLVTSRHVLTAAHCVHNHENDLYLVRLGELDLAREDEGATPLDVLLKEKIKHEEYNPKAFTSDIAVLVTKTPVTFTELIKPICLPRVPALRSMTFERYNPIIAGWGDTEFRGPAATHLQVLQLPVVSNQFCAEAYKQYKEQKIDERVLCAGYKKGGKDACQGDSGGPLMQPIYNSVSLTSPMYQIGVVSYGRKCAEAGFPGVYSRVTHFAPWLEEKITGTRGSSR